MKELKATIIRTTCGKAFDLRKAAPLASNVTAPYGNHNFIVFKTNNGFYLKGFNTGSQNALLNAFELISRNEAMYHFQKQLGNTNEVALQR
jgi:hypothetical protein